MVGHKICFYGEIWLVIPKLSLLPLLSGALVENEQRLSFSYHKKITLYGPNWSLFFQRNL